MRVDILTESKQVIISSVKNEATDIKTIDGWIRALRVAREWLRKELEPPKAKGVTICEECGVNYADPPSKLCPGCEAYQEHQK